MASEAYFVANIIYICSCRVLMAGTYKSSKLCAFQCGDVPLIGTADISATNMLIFTVSVIGTDNQRSHYKC